MRSLPLLILLFFVTPLARAEFGWMAGFEKFELRFGGDYLSTANNFTTDAEKTAIRFTNGDFIKINEFKFYAEPEYGFAPDWSVKARLGFTTNNATSDTGRTSGTLLSGSGLGDFSLGVKYRIRPGKPSLIFEALTTVPTYTRNAGVDDLLVGDGSIDLGLYLHGVYSMRRFFFAASPHFILRTGGYAPKIGINVGAGVKYAPVFFMPYLESFFSLGSGILFDSSEYNHDPYGSGKSYLRLSGSPSGMNIGAKLGVNAGKSTFAEIYFRTSVYGIRYAAFTQFGMNLMFRFDFKEPDTSIKTKEIPFDKSPEDFAPPETTTEVPTESP